MLPKLLFLTSLLFLSTATIRERTFLNDNFNSIPSDPQRQYVGYFQSWSEKWASQGSNLDLANVPEYVTLIILSFMRPDATYNGFESFSGTGLDFSADGSVVKDAIGIAQSKGAKVTVAVGGATYTNWDSLNADAIARFVKDFGLDGVDIDFEPTNPDCTATNGQVTCPSDATYQNAVSQLRAALPSPYILSAAGWSVGAYGEGSYTNEQPASAYTGIAVNMLKSAAGQSLDQVNIMSYDAGTTYDPTQAFQAYRSLFNGKLALGVEVPPEAWGGHVLTVSELDNLCDFVNQNGKDGDGMMLWSLHKKPNGVASPGDPNPTIISQEVCNKFGLQQCNIPIPF